MPADSVERAHVQVGLPAGTPTALARAAGRRSPRAEVLSRQSRSSHRRAGRQHAPAPERAPVHSTSQRVFTWISARARLIVPDGVEHHGRSTETARRQSIRVEAGQPSRGNRWCPAAPPPPALREIRKRAEDRVAKPAAAANHVADVGRPHRAHSTPLSRTCREMTKHSRVAPPAACARRVTRSRPRPLGFPSRRLPTGAVPWKRQRLVRCPHPRAE